jgi:peptide/nickel transport system substrate-binding protein
MAIGLMSKDISPPSTLRQQFLPVSFFLRAGLLTIPMRIICPCFTVKTFTNGPNYTHFKRRIRQLYEQAFKETNDKKRYILYQKMDEIIMMKPCNSFVL